MHVKEAPGHPGWALIAAEFLPVFVQWPLSHCLVSFFSSKSEENKKLFSTTVICKTFSETEK